MLVNMLKGTPQELNDFEKENYNEINKRLLEMGFQIKLYDKNYCDCHCRLDRIELYPVDIAGDILNNDGSIGGNNYHPRLKASELDSENDVNMFLSSIETAFERFRVFEKLKELGFLHKKVKAVVVETNVKEIEIELNERNLLRIIEKHANLQDLINIENNETEVFENIIPSLDFEERYFKGMFKIIKEKTDVFSFLKEKIK